MENWCIFVAESEGTGGSGKQCRINVAFMEQDYNTKRKQLILPEYGRNIQIMVDHLKTIKDREERNRAARTVVAVMGNLYPQLRELPDFRHKLWDHLAIMGNFELDIDSPYPLPSAERLMERPARIPYSNHRIRLRHYGLMTEKMIAKIKEMRDPAERRALTVLTANHMKKEYLTWNKDSVEDAQIFADLRMMSNGEVEIPEGLVLSRPQELLQTPNLANKTGNRQQQGKKKKKNNFYKKRPNNNINNN